jgi:hypothetical protein
MIPAPPVLTPKHAVAHALMIDTDLFLRELLAAAKASGAFAESRIDSRSEGSSLLCKAKDASADAWYSIVPQAAGWWVRLATADRWLSESIEADLMHHGDPIEELVEEELVELGHDPKLDGPMPQVKHFRSEDKLYTFESAIPLQRALDSATAANIAARFLLAYEAAFRQLGDMEGGDD